MHAKRLQILGSLCCNLLAIWMHLFKILSACDIRKDYTNGSSLVPSG